MKDQNCAGRASCSSAAQQTTHQSTTESEEEDGDWDFGIGKLVIDLDTSDTPTDNSTSNNATTSDMSNCTTPNASAVGQTRPPPAKSQDSLSTPVVQTSGTMKVKIRRTKGSSGSKSSHGDLNIVKVEPNKPQNPTSTSPHNSHLTIVTSEKQHKSEKSGKTKSGSSKKDKHRDKSSSTINSNAITVTNSVTGTTVPQRSLDNHPTPALASYALAHAASSPGPNSTKPVAVLSAKTTTFLTSQRLTAVPQANKPSTITFAAVKPSVTATMSVSKAAPTVNVVQKASTPGKEALPPMPGTPTNSQPGPPCAGGLSPPGKPQEVGPVPGVTVKREAPSHDPYEFNAKVEDRIRVPVKKIKVEKVEMTSSPPPSAGTPETSSLQANAPTNKTDVAVETCSQAIITEPDCLGPCEPGTHVTLEGIVWNETPNGLLVVNVTWRDKSYVGTLMDATRHDWAPPRPNCDTPTSDIDTRTPKGRGGKRGRGGSSQKSAAAPENASDRTLRSTSTRRANNGSSSSGNCWSGWSSNNVPRSTENSNKRKAKSEPADLAVSEGQRASKRTRSDSKTSDSGSCDAQGFIECPEPHCGKKYRHINGLKYHQNHAHRNGVSCSSKEGTDDDRKESEESRAPSSEPQQSSMEVSSESYSDNSKNDSPTEQLCDNSELYSIKVENSAESTQTLAQESEVSHKKKGELVKSAVASVTASKHKEVKSGNKSKDPTVSKSSVLVRMPDVKPPKAQPVGVQTKVVVAPVSQPVAQEPKKLAAIVPQNQTVTITPQVNPVSANVTTTSMVYQLAASSIGCLGTIVTQAPSQLAMSGVATTIVQAAGATPPVATVAGTTPAITAMPVSMTTAPTVTQHQQLMANTQSQQVVDLHKKQRDLAKVEKKCKTIVSSARPIMPAPSPRVQVAVHPASAAVTGHSMSPAAQSISAQVNTVTSQLKPIQPKPTIMGEPSAVNPALASLKQMKDKKSKKKKKDRDREKSKDHHHHHHKHSKSQQSDGSKSSKSSWSKNSSKGQEAVSGPPKLEKQLPVVVSAVSPAKATASVSGVVQTETSVSPIQPPAPPAVVTSVSANNLVAPPAVPEDAHSPAYSDISDANEAAPTLEKEAQAPALSEAATPSGDVPVSSVTSANTDSYTVYSPYYSQPPYLTPAVSTGTTAAPSPDKNIDPKSTVAQYIGKPGEKGLVGYTVKAQPVRVVTKTVIPEVQVTATAAAPALKELSPTSQSTHKVQLPVNKTAAMVVGVKPSMSLTSDIVTCVPQSVVTASVMTTGAIVVTTPQNVAKTLPQMAVVNSTGGTQYVYQQLNPEYRAQLVKQQQMLQQQQLQQQLQQQQQQLQQQQQHIILQQQQKHKVDEDKQPKLPQEIQPKTPSAPIVVSPLVKTSESGGVVASREETASVPPGNNRPESAQLSPARPPPPSLISDKEKDERKRREILQEQNLKDKQNENRQILKENIELKAQMSDSGRVSGNKPESYDQKMIDRHRQFYLMQQQQQQQQQHQQQQQQQQHQQQQQQQRYIEHQRFVQAQQAQQRHGSMVPLPGKSQEGNQRPVAIATKLPADSTLPSPSQERAQEPNKNESTTKILPKELLSPRTPSASKDSVKDSPREGLSSTSHPKKENDERPRSVSSSGSPALTPKPTMMPGKEGVPIPMSYAQYFPHPFMQTPHYGGPIQIDPNHPGPVTMFSGINPMLGYAPSAAYIHPSQVRFRLPLGNTGDTPDKNLVHNTATPETKPLDLAQVANYSPSSQQQQQQQQHKIHELKELGKTPEKPQSPSAQPPSDAKDAAAGDRGDAGKDGVAQMQRHVHTHHHTHLMGAAYPVYPYGATILAPPVSSAPAISPHPYVSTPTPK